MSNFTHLLIDAVKSVGYPESKLARYAVTTKFTLGSGGIATA